MLALLEKLQREIAEQQQSGEFVQGSFKSLVHGSGYYDSLEHTKVLLNLRIGYEYPMFKNYSEQECEDEVTLGYFSDEEKAIRTLLVRKEAQYRHLDLEIAKKCSKSKVFTRKWSDPNPATFNDDYKWKKKYADHPEVKELQEVRESLDNLSCEIDILRALLRNSLLSRFGRHHAIRKNWQIVQIDAD